MGPYSILEIFEYVAVGVLSILGIVAIVYLAFNFRWETIFLSIPLYCLFEWLLLLGLDP